MKSYVLAWVKLCVPACILLFPLTGSAQTFSPSELSRYAAEAARVTIIRDGWDVPHIYGKTDADVVFGLLYTECAADFPRVEKNYLEVLGRQAEAYGPAYLNNDLQMRLIEDSADAIRDYHNSPVWLAKLLDAFADGVNYYLYKHPECKPLLLNRFQPWFPLMFTDGSVSATSTGGIRQDEIRNFYMKGDSTAVVMNPPAEPYRSAVSMNPSAADAGPASPETGSNGFAIAPSRTANGRALLYINPHVPFYFRLEVHLVSEEGLNTYGAVTWGQFFVYQGFNAHCGWMHTSSYADVADLYREQVKRQGDQWVYRYNDQWKAVRSKSIVLRYKRHDAFSGSDTMWQATVTAYYTHHGPVMGSRDNMGSGDIVGSRDNMGFGDSNWLSLKEYNRSMAALEEAWLITRAGDFKEYKAAMNLRANTTNNTVYADDKGNIAYWHGNFMPKRNPNFDWSLPVEGTDSSTEWKPSYGPDEIVHVYNPASGWIQNCNSTPFAVSGSSSPRREDYPVYMAPDGQNFRSVNAIRILGRARRWTMDSLIANGYDHYLAAFDVLLPSLFAAYRSAPDSIKQALKDPIQLLRLWNRRASDTSVATTLAVEWGSRMAQKAPRVATVEQATNAVAMIRGEADGSSDAEKTGYLADVLADLTKRFGAWQVTWGRINRYQRLTGKINEVYDDNQPSHPVSFASSAFGSIPSFQSRVMNGTRKRYGYSGNSFIAAVEFGPKVRARTISTGGESSDPLSPHFSDQAPGYIGGVFKEVYFYKDDVLSHAEKTYHPGEEQ
jgi:acyl-homoserine-lactone acylase